MAAASPRPSDTPLTQLAPASPASNSSTQGSSERWVEALRWIALAVFVAVPVFALLVQPLAGRVVWTVLIAALPLFIVLVGYHRWRRICPLAFVAQIPVRLRRPGTRKASPWLETNYYTVACAVFLFSLWLRLIATNGDGRAIALFFIFISLAALIFGATYTGKTWCNYICPVSFVEKIYTEPHGLRETENSQCAKCSACKKFCPDINEENGYWKEIESPAKRRIYYAFPGIVFGFYFYYYLQSGTWDYYFGGRWTNEPGLFRTAFLPGLNANSTAGLFFLPGIPRALASILTLGCCALASFIIFSLLEPLVGKYLRRRDAETDAARARHVMLALASFAAFVIFYSFAGQPSLRRIKLLPAPHLVLIAVVFTATLFLVRRLRRRPKDFAEETLARNFIRRWEWTDVQPPKDLHEAFLIHTIRSRESARGSAQVLEIYKDAVRETLANGYVTRDEMHLLESLRNQMQIKPADHEKIMAALAEEERAMIKDPSKQVSAEKRLQLETYGHALRKYLEEALAEGNPNESFIMQLRAEYGVTKEEHAGVLAELLDSTGGMAARLAEELRTIALAAQSLIALELRPSPTHDFLADLMRRRQARAVESLLRGLSLTLDDETQRAVGDALCGADEALRESVVEKLRESLPATIAERLITAYRETARREATLPTLTDMLYVRLDNVDPYVRAAALYALGERGAADAKALLRMSADEHEIVRETARHLKERAGQGAIETGKHAGLITIEKMIALRAAPVFSRLAPEGLAELARSSLEAQFAPGENLCVEGEPGNEVFILLAGDVNVFLKSDDGGERWANSEKAGGIIGELAVLDPAPRSATLRAGSEGTRVLRLDGEAFRHALDADPSIASGVIHTLARRLRGTHKSG